MIDMVMRSLEAFGTEQGIGSREYDLLVFVISQSVGEGFAQDLQSITGSGFYLDTAFQYQYDVFMREIAVAMREALA